jgi:hypothetical protein
MTDRDQMIGDCVDERRRATDEDMGPLAGCKSSLCQHCASNTALLACPAGWNLPRERMRKDEAVARPMQPVELAAIDDVPLRSRRVEKARRGAVRE